MNREKEEDNWETQRLKTFKNIWQKHNRFDLQQNKQDKKGYFDDISSDKLYGILNSIPEFHELNIKSIGSKLQMSVE